MEEVGEESEVEVPGVLDVGTKPLGDGRFGQSDLAGNVWEPTLDAYVYQYPTPCTDCASVKGEDFHVFRGGSARDTTLHLRTSRRDLFGPKTNYVFSWQTIGGDSGIGVMSAYRFAAALDDIYEKPVQPGG